MNYVAIYAHRKCPHTEFPPESQQVSTYKYILILILVLMNLDYSNLA